jgi:hypothetical protein
MTEIIKETTTTKEGNTNPVAKTPVGEEATNSQTIEYLVYFIFGVLEILLAFRLVLKLLGASLSSGFVAFIYGITGIFISPFAGIFRSAVSQGLEAKSVLEPANIVALIVYAVIAWGIVKLVRIFSGEKQTV